MGTFAVASGSFQKYSSAPSTDFMQNTPLFLFYFKNFVLSVKIVQCHDDEKLFNSKTL